MVKRNHALIIFFLLFCQTSLAVLTDSLIDSIIDQELQTSNFAIVVKDPETEEIIYQHNAHKYLSPASNTKLFPAVAALLSLGPDYRYKTEVGYDPKKLKNKILYGNLYIHFSGDPSLQDKHIESILKDLDIKQINGNIVMDNSRFIRPDVPPGTSYDDLGWYYAARSPAIIINENAFKVVFRANALVGRPMSITPLEDTFGLLLNTDVKTVSDAVAKRTCDLVIRQQLPNRINLFGCWPVSKKERPEKLSVPDPSWWAGEIIKRKLLKLKMRLLGRVQEGIWQQHAVVKETHHSRPLKDLLKHTLYESDNLYADSIAKTIAAEVRHVGSYKEASTAIKQILKKKEGLNIDDINISDGAGTRYNLMTALQIAELLNLSYKKPAVKDSLMQALPLSGVRGSLRERLTEYDLRGKVFAKTGTMHDISSLAGYLVLPDKRVLIFAMMTNNYNGKIETLKRTEDAIVRAIWSTNQ